MSRLAADARAAAMDTARIASLQLRLCLGAIELDYFVVEAALIECIPVGEGFGDFAVDVLDCFEHTFPLKAVGISVTQFDGLVLAGGCAAGNDGAAHGAVAQAHFCFYGRIAAGVQNFSGVNGCDI